MAYQNDSIRVCRLYEKTSAKGNTYLTGRWGGARITVLKSSRDVAEDGGAIWHVMLSQAPARAREVDATPDATAVSATEARQPDTSAQQRLDDEIPF